MALDIYESASPSSAFSVSGAFTNPASMTFNGIIGETVEKKYYVRNDDATYWYDTIQVLPVDGGQNIVDGSGNTDGYEWKLYAGDTQPSSEQWLITSAGNTISLSNLGSAGNADTFTYLPFWVQVTVPRGALVQSYSSVLLRLSFNQNNV